MKFILKLIILFGFILLSTTLSFAASYEIISLSYFAFSDCSPYILPVFNVNSLGTTDDTGTGGDYLAFVPYDGYGNALIPSTTGLLVGSGYDVVGVYIESPSARPITIKVYDITSAPIDITVAQIEAGILLDTFTFDPGDYGVCLDVPLVAAPSPSNSADPQPPFVDGRINNWDTASPVVLFGHDGETGRGLVMYSPEGELLLLVSAEDIAAVEECPAENTLIASAGNISLYRLTDCRYQLNAPSLDGTKTYVLIFNDLYENTGYTSYEE